MQTRRATDPASAGDLGALDAEAIARVREEERPDPRDADELHDALLTAGFLTCRRAGGRPARSCSTELTAARRAGSATIRRIDARTSRRIFVAVERLPELRADPSRTLAVAAVAAAAGVPARESLDARRRDRRDCCAAGSR